MELPIRILLPRRLEDRLLKISRNNTRNNQYSSGVLIYRRVEIQETVCCHVETLVKTGSGTPIKPILDYAKEETITNFLSDHILEFGFMNWYVHPNREHANATGVRLLYDRKIQKDQAFIALVIVGEEVKLVAHEDRDIRIYYEERDGFTQREQAIRKELNALAGQLCHEPLY